MFKVSLKNLNNEIGWEALFETYEEAASWAKQQLVKPNRMQLPVEEIIKDLSLDKEYVLKEIKEKRKLEYPNELEIIEALIEEKEGRLEKLQEVIKKRNEVKLKYPINESLRGAK